MATPPRSLPLAGLRRPSRHSRAGEGTLRRAAAADCPCCSLVLSKCLAKMMTNQATLLILASLLPAALPNPAEEYTGGRSKWRDEFCRTKFCAVMSASQQGTCCDAYSQCCAYANLHRKADPFAYLDSHEVAETPPPPPTPPPTPPPPTFSHRDIYVGPPKSMRLREEGTPSRQPPSLSLTRDHDNHNTNHHRHRHRHHQRRPAPPPPRPAILLLDGGEDLMKTSYNDHLVKGQERVCKHSYCSLLSPSQHKLCCNIYDACCAYANYHKAFDPFHPDNGNRRR